ncbi:MAG: diaminopimelate dehydrogenase [Oscillospiraceae bacterium]|nr:diaminopimelate dehydrogenase [Oscillospiraceae bacterium]
MQTIRIGIAGYGNVGKGAALAVSTAPDMELKAIFTRRKPESIKTINDSISVLPIEKAASMKNEIDVMLLCGGSATDLPEQAPYFASMFNTVDSYDNHAKIPEYMAAVDAAAVKTTAIISAGWDPGPFSMMRSLFESIIPDGATYTFWGKGVSQGHSDAIRRIDGVKHAVQYTVPIDSAVQAVRSGGRPDLKARDKMKRDCYVVIENGADKNLIEESIKNMPHYFADYDTSVSFIDMEEFNKNHTEMPHGGMVLRSGNTGKNKQVMEFSLNLESNPEFTGSIMTAYARAAYKMSKEGLYGAKTVLDVPLHYLSEKDRATLIKELL